MLRRLLLVVFGLLGVATSVAMWMDSDLTLWQWAVCLAGSVAVLVAAMIPRRKRIVQIKTIGLIEMGGGYAWQLVEKGEVIEMSKKVYRDRDQAHQAAKDFLHQEALWLSCDCDEQATAGIGNC